MWGGGFVGGACENPKKKISHFSKIKKSKKKIKESVGNSHMV